MVEQIEQSETAIPYWAKEEKLTEDDLLNDDTFLGDAQQTLYQRTGQTYIEPKEILDAYLEQFRVSNVNEISALKDLNYLRSKNTSQEDVNRMGRLYLAFDNYGMKGVGLKAFGSKILDYTEGVVTSPSTYAGLISGGIGKLAGVGGTRAAIALAKSLATKQVKSSLKERILKAGVPAALKAAAVEGGIEAGADTARQESRILTNIQEKFSPLRLATSSVAAGILPGVVSGAVQTGRAGQREALGALLNKGAAAKATRIKEADAAAKESLGKNKSIYEELVKSSGTLQALEKTRVARGAEIRGNKAFGSTILDYAENVDKDALVDLDINLNISILERMTALTVDLLKSSGASTADIVKRMSDNEGRPLRIIDILANEIERGSTKVAGKGTDVAETAGILEFKKLIKTYELEFSDVAALFAHEFSEAGRVLNIASQAKRNVSEFISATRDASKLRAGAEGKLTSTLDENADKVIKNEVSGWQFIKNMDAVRKGLMVMQPATTMRNTINAGFRTALEAFENVGQGAVQMGLATSRGLQTKGDKELFQLGLRNITSPLYLAKYIAADTVAARGIQALFADASPVAAQRLYRSMADVVEEMPDEAKKQVAGFSGGLVRMARYGNAINTLSDNAFKRAMFAAELTKEVGGTKALNKIIGDGKFATDITEEQFENATTRALELTYQKSYKRGTAGQIFTNAFSHPGLSGIIPFPRFIANSLEFTYKHAPILGALPLERLRIFGGAVKKGEVRTGRDASKIMSQQLTGLGMLSGALTLRASFGDDTKWHQRKDSRGEYKDIKALFGPFAIWMLLADVMTRASNVAERAGGDPLVKGTMIKRFDATTYLKTVKDPAVWHEVLSEIDSVKLGREALKAGLGTAFKSGLNLSVVDKALTEWVETGKSVNAAKPIADIFGSYAGSFLTPFGLLKDVQDAVSNKEDARFYKDTDLVDPFARFFAKASRSLRLQPTTIYERIPDPTGGYRGRPEDATSGIVKQLTGETKIQMPTAIRKALNSLNLESYEVFRRKYKDPELNKIHMAFYSRWSETVGAQYVLSDAYNKSADGKLPAKNSVKKNRLIEKIQEGLVDSNGKKITFEEFYIDWANKNLSGDRLIEVKGKVLKVKYDEYSQTLIDAVRGEYNSFAKRENAMTGSTLKMETSFDSLTLPQRIKFIEEYKANK